MLEAELDETLLKLDCELELVEILDWLLADGLDRLVSELEDVLDAELELGELLELEELLEELLDELDDTLD